MRKARVGASTFSFKLPHIKPLEAVFIQQCRRFLPDFLCVKVAPQRKPFLTALDLCEDSHGNPSEQAFEALFMLMAEVSVQRESKCCSN